MWSSYMKAVQLQSCVHLVVINSALVFHSLFPSGSNLDNATAILNQDFGKPLIVVQYKLYNLASTCILVSQCIGETASGIQGNKLWMCTKTVGFSLCFSLLIHLIDLFQLR